MADPTITVRNTTAPRGGVFEVVVAMGDTDPATARVELLLVERKHETLVDVKRNHARVLGSAPIGTRDQTVSLGVPIDLPDPYRGERIGWDYEVRLVVDRLGPDARATVPVVVAGEVDIGSGSSPAPVLGTAAVSRPGHLGGPKNGATGELVVFAIGLVALGSFMTWIGLTVEGSGRLIPLVLGPVVVLFAAAIAVGAFRQKRHRVGADVWRLPEGPFRRGATIVVPVVEKGGARLEVGLLTIELEVTTVGKRRTAVQRRIGETWQRADGGHVVLVVPTDLPPTYAGHEVAVQWMLAVRDHALPDAARDASIRFEPILVW